MSDSEKPFLKLLYMLPASPACLRERVSACVLPRRLFEVSGKSCPSFSPDGLACKYFPPEYKFESIDSCSFESQDRLAPVGSNFEVGAINLELFASSFPLCAKRQSQTENK